MNYTRNPHLGGTPKGYRWIYPASAHLVDARARRERGDMHGCNKHLGHALSIIYQHSRSPETRHGALELLAVLHKMD